MMSENVLILTAIYGGYDRPKPAPFPVGAWCRCLLVTDSEETAAEAKRLGWETLIRARGKLPPRYAAKAWKCAPHLVLPKSPAGIAAENVVWLDASIEFKGDLQALLDAIPPGDVGTFRHRLRDCIYTEVTESLHSPRYQGQPLSEQASAYAFSGHPPNWGLWETGMVVWRDIRTFSRLRMFGEKWLAEQLAWSDQDQVSFPYVARLMKVSGSEVVTLPGTVEHNAWTTLHKHGVYDP